MIDAYASERHYLDHLAPIWFALRISERGEFHVARNLVTHAAEHGIRGVPHPPPRKGGPILVASYQDHRRVQPRPVVYVEHGAGQRYEGDERSKGHGSYSGGRDHHGAVLFLAPSETVAARWRDAYPDVPAVAVGVPKLDPWHRDREMTKSFRAEAPTVAVAFHCDVNFDGYQLPEGRSAYPWFHDGLPALAAAFPGALGHAHPRLFPRVKRSFENAGLTPVEDFADVLDRADVLAVDTSSVGWEFMSTGRPVVWLNAPWFRRDVHHGLRFWTHAGSGVQCDEPGQLAGAVERALADDDPVISEARERAIAEVYSFTDGRAGARAGHAVSGVLRCYHRGGDEARTEADST